MAGLQNKKLRKSLAEQAQENTTVTIGKKNDQRPVKTGTPNDHSRKHLDGDIPTVGVSIGTTLNMDNYESLRADVWLTDSVQDGESIEEAYARVTQVVSSTLEQICSQYRGD